MAKVTAPLLSFGGSGSLAKSVVYSTWKGVPYARRHVIPANPNTQAQQVTRKTFALLREMWKVAPVLVSDAWNAFASGRPFTGMNKFVGENIRTIRGDANMNNFIGSPGAQGGLPPMEVTAQAGVASGEIAVSVVAPDAPDGWALTMAVATAFHDQDPAQFFEGPFVAGSVADPAGDITLEGLGSAEACQVAAWLVWTKPNGKKAYSVGVTVQAASAA